MIKENLAERLYCDLKNSQIKIENARYVVDGSRIGDVPNMKQIVLSCFNNKHNVNYGPAFEEGELSFTEAYAKLLNIIKEMKHIQFHNLVIPKNCVIVVEQIEYQSIVSRYIKDYLNMSDQVLERWDFMVSPV